MDLESDLKYTRVCAVGSAMAALIFANIGWTASVLPFCTLAIVFAILSIQPTRLGEDVSKQVDSEETVD